VPGNGGRTRPSVAEPTPAPAAPDIGRPRYPMPLVGPPERAPEHAPGHEEPRRPFAGARGALARLVPGRGARTTASQAAEFDAAARKAYQSALTLETGAPLAPAPPAARSAGAPTSAPLTVPLGTPATPTTAPASGPTTPDAASAAAPLGTPATQTTAPASGPTTPDAASAAAPVATPATAARASAWATPPRMPAEQSAPPGGEAPVVSPAPPSRRKPGETAPDFLLRTPTSVAPVADDFFDGLTRRVEGDR